MKFKGVIFDFNGTLFWDTPLHNKAWDIFLEKHGIVISDLDKHEKIHGQNNKDILNTVFYSSLSDDDNKRLSVEKELIYQELCLQTEMQLAPGAIRLLEFLKNKAVKYTIATASEKINVDFYFKHLELNKYFDYSKVVYNNGKISGKPDPTIFIHAIEVLGLKPDETIIFEDSVAGIEAAVHAQVGGIIIVNSNNNDYTNWHFPIIKNFDEVDRSLF